MGSAPDQDQEGCNYRQKHSKKSKEREQRVFCLPSSHPSTPPLLVDLGEAPSARLASWLSAVRNGE